MRRKDKQPKKQTFQREEEHSIKLKKQKRALKNRKYGDRDWLLMLEEEE